MASNITYLEIIDLLSKSSESSEFDIFLDKVEEKPNVVTGNAEGHGYEFFKSGFMLVTANNLFVIACLKVRGGDYYSAFLDLPAEITSSDSRTIVRDRFRNPPIISKNIHKHMELDQFHLTDAKGDDCSHLSDIIISVVFAENLISEISLSRIW